MENEKAIFFWRENNKYGFLSNFYYSNFIDANNTKYICNEQYFISQKCLLFDETNIELYNKIMESKLPMVIKKLGRLVKNFDERIWEKEKYEIMKNGLRYKFNQNKLLKNKLLDTKMKSLYEASKYDLIWGIGVDSTQASKITESSYPGKNLLGKALMEIREEIRNKK